MPVDPSRVESFFIPPRSPLRYPSRSGQLDSSSVAKASLVTRYPGVAIAPYLTLVWHNMARFKSLNPNRVSPIDDAANAQWQGLSDWPTNLF